ncbi:hypothetical protein HMPREF9154_2747 [Arachnia propionica F0230a]|nr:hypothetical protein HMPREF9154_2747 [Arachnia propionica F0230a]
MAGTIHDGHVTVAVRRSVSMESGLEGRNNLTDAQVEMLWLLSQ